MMQIIVKVDIEVEVGLITMVLKGKLNALYVINLAIYLLDAHIRIKMTLNYVLNVAWVITPWRIAP